ncbi:MAG: 30S ribosomal protein S6 [Rhodospirillales bacterium]|nr:30S ribosomal protein S6 [Rhodospirillales bacterium]
MAYYECVFIARQDISATQVEGLCETFSKVISDNGGSVVTTENWGLRTLSYRINKNRKAHYVLFNIDAPAPAIHEMERQMRINEDILRYLTIKLDAFEEGPSVMMQSRQRDERPRSYDNNDDSNTPVAVVAEAATVESAETASDGAEA